MREEEEKRGKKFGAMAISLTQSKIREDQGQIHRYTNTFKGYVARHVHLGAIHEIILRRFWCKAGNGKTMCVDEISPGQHTTKVKRKSDQQYHVLHINRYTYLHTVYSTMSIVGA